MTKLLYFFVITSAFFTVIARRKFRDGQYAPQSRYCWNSPVDDGPPYRYHRETGQCYMVGEKGPCGELMAFTLEDNDFGVCDCDLKKRCGRPLIYWPPKNRCYYVNEQGPCRDGKWLVFGFDLNAVCRRNICAEEETRRPSVDGKFWFAYKGKCFRTYTQGYCNNPDEILFNMATHYRPVCTENTQCRQQQFQKQKCLPGQRLDFMGKCQRALQSLNGFNKNVTEYLEVTSKPTNIHCLYCNRDSV